MTNRPGPLGQRIAAELRAELGRQRHSGRWLAQHIDAPQNTVNRWLGGETAPSLDALDAMCRALGLSVADVLKAVEQNGGYEPVTSLPRRRAAPDNREVSSRDTDRYVSPDLLVDAA